ncbi:MAG TPA: glycosyltransferase [Vicinamibacteria bacterium]|nr:glycosyltransferase [Vicinamibacteria bacterium]
MNTSRIAYILSRFPCYDEVFLLREIHAVAARLDTWIFTLRSSHEPVVHDEARALLPRTLYVAFLVSPRILRAHALLLRRRPRRYLAALARLVAGNWRSPEFLLKNLAFFPKAVWLAQWAIENGVTHVHAGWATYAASVAHVVSGISGVPFSFSGHAHDIYLNTTHLAEKIRHAAFVTTCTVANAVHLRGLAPECPSAHLAVIHHGIRVSDFRQAREGDEPLHILSVGTLNPHKGFAYLIDALARLAGEGHKFHCTIVGGGPLDATLRAQLTGARLDDRVTMTGPLKHADVLPHYSRASVFVLMAQPEWHWGIPNVLIEALAARCAVITTRFGSVEELVKDGETGLLVPPRDSAALAEAIRGLAENQALRRRLAEAGHRVVASEFDLERATEEYVRRFQGLPA